MLRSALVVICVSGLSVTSDASAQDGASVPELPLIWEYATPKEFPQGIAIDTLGRPLLHVAVRNGLWILDIGDKKGPPKQLAKLGIEHFGSLPVMHVTQAGEHLYLPLGDHFAHKGAHAGLAVVNIKDPRRPKVVSVWKSESVMTGAAIVVVEGRYAYLGAMKQGVMIFDSSKPEKLEHVSTFQPDIHFPQKNPPAVRHPNARGLALRGDLLYVAYDAGGLRVVDVSNKKKPKEVGRYINKQMLHKQQAYNDILLDKNLAYIPADYAGMEILDIQNPSDIRPVGWWNPWQAHAPLSIWFNSAGHTNQIALDTAKKWVYLSAGDSELQVVDVSDPARPKLAARYGEPKNKFGAWGLTMSDDRVYLAYITAIIPFQSGWAGIKAVKR